MKTIFPIQSAKRNTLVDKQHKEVLKQWINARDKIIL